MSSQRLTLFTNLLAETRTLIADLDQTAVDIRAAYAEQEAEVPANYSKEYREKRAQLQSTVDLCNRRIAEEEAKLDEDLLAMRTKVEEYLGSELPEGLTVERLQGMRELIADPLVTDDTKRFLLRQA